MNSVFSSPKGFVPGYKEISYIKELGFAEWIFPAFGIPIRNPAIANMVATKIDQLIQT
jgi:hypothetical protein